MEKNALRFLVDARDDGLEIEVDRRDGWETWDGSHYNKGWGFRIQYPSGGWKIIQTKEK